MELLKRARADYEAHFVESKGAKATNIRKTRAIAAALHRIEDEIDKLMRS